MHDQTEVHLCFGMNETHILCTCQKVTDTDLFIAFTLALYIISVIHKPHLKLQWVHLNSHTSNTYHSSLGLIVWNVKNKSLLAKPLSPLPCPAQNDQEVELYIFIQL